MPTIRSKTLFFTTSPRSPLKIIPEIQLLIEQFEGRVWNSATQEEFAHALISAEFYQGSPKPNNPAFSARDRINRAPRAYGFVDLKPTIALTETGKAYINSRHKEEPLLRQLVKFQLPSPLYPEAKNKPPRFWVKPYLELLRLIHHFGNLTFDEIMIFGMQLVDYRLFDEIVSKIEAFRIERSQSDVRYSEFFKEVYTREIKEIYKEEIESKQYITRESTTSSEDKFIETKKNNLRDYTDACFRYLRGAGVVSISQRNRSISIASEKTKEVEYLLSTISRDPVHVKDLVGYKNYLYDPELPKLYTDDFSQLSSVILEIDSTVDCSSYSLPQLKDLQFDLLDQKRQRAISSYSQRLRNYQEYDDIMETFKNIRSRGAYIDRPLMFEWNTWRAMTMIGGGEINANLHFDDAGNPSSTAAGNKADIVCDYGDFILNVEVTLQAGQKQYDNEGEPVARHVGTTCRESGKPTYCLFIAPKVNEATIAHFYTLLHTSIYHYGGKATIIPLHLSTFEGMITRINQTGKTPDSRTILRLVNRVRDLGLAADNEKDWFDKTEDAALNWLS